MKQIFLIYFKIITIFWVTGSQSQETCEEYNSQLISIDGVLPRFIGEIGSFSISGADSLTTSGTFQNYFSAELIKQDNKIKIFTTDNFADYEKHNSNYRPTLVLNIKCQSSSTSTPSVRITIAAVNNFAPEFTNTVNEIKIPTPMPRGFEITSLVDDDNQITAIDYDLYFNAIKFTISGTDMFDVQAILIEGVKLSYRAKIVAKQQIVKLENDEIEFQLTATDSFSEPKSTTVRVKVFTDPEVIFIESPRFEKPLYKGLIKADGNLNIEDILVDEDTFDENVKFEVMDDRYEMIQMKNDVRKVKISVIKEKLPEEAKFVNFLIAVKREGDRSGFAAVILETSSINTEYSFTKSVYEGELKEKGRVLSLEEIKLSGTASPAGLDVKLSQRDFNAKISDGKIVIELKQSAQIENLVQKNLLFLQIEILKDGATVATTSVLIKTVPILIPNFEENFYKFSIKDGKLSDASLWIKEDSFSADEEYAVSVVPKLLDAEIVGRQIKLTIKPETQLPTDKNFINFQIDVNVKSSSIKNSAIVVLELETLENPQKSLKFDSFLYQGKLSQDLSLSLSPITLNNTEDVQIQLSGKHGLYFEHQFQDDKLILKLKNGIEFEQFSTDIYIQITITASRKNFISATSNVIIGIEKKSNENNSAFEKSLYVGSVNDQKLLEVKEISIKSDNEFSIVRVSGTDADYFKAEINENKVMIALQKDITEGLLLEKKILSVKITAEYENAVISTNLIVTLPRPDEIKKLKFEKSHTIGKIDVDSDLKLDIDKITLQLANYDETVRFSLTGTDADFFSFDKDANHVQIKLKPAVDIEVIKRKTLLSLSVVATRNGFESAEHYVFINVKNLVDTPIDQLVMFEKSLYIGQIDDQNVINLETIKVDSGLDFTVVEVTGEDAEYFNAKIESNVVTISLKSPINIQILQKTILLAKITAKHASTSAFTNLVVKLPKINEIKSLKFEKSYSVGKILKNPETALQIDDIILDPTNYNSDVQFSLNRNNYFEFTRNVNKLQLKLKSGPNQGSLDNDEYFLLTIKAARDGFKTAEHLVFVYFEVDPVDDSDFENSLYIGSINNQKILNVNSMLIKSNHVFEEANVTGSDAEYFSATIEQNFVLIKLKKEITENLLMQKSILSAKILAEFQDIKISTNLIVILPKINEDKILRFEKSHYIGTLSNLNLNIKDIVLELNNYHESVEFTLTGSDKDFFSLERNQNTLKLKLSSEARQEDFENRVFLTLSVSASRNEYATAETAIFIHLNVIVDGITPIEFSKPVYRGTLTFDNVLTVEKISITSEENGITIALNGEHYEKFRIDSENLKDMKIRIDPQPIDFGLKFYYFYIEALKFGAPSAYATIVIEIVDKVQLQFDRINYFGKIDDEKNLIMDEIPLNSELGSSDVSFRLSEGQNRFFSFDKNSTDLAITKHASISITNVNFLWFYLEAYGHRYHQARTLILIEYPQDVHPPPNICNGDLDETQPIFETGSYTFSIANDAIGDLGRIRASIKDPNDTIASYGLLFETNYLENKLRIENNGDIKIISPITIGIYRMIGTARSEKSKKSAETKILLTVVEAKVCEGGKEVTTVKKILAIEKIEENLIVDKVMSSAIGECEYEIMEVTPNALKGYLTIDKTTHYIKNVKSFDRESPIFADYHVAQVQIKMSLNCDKETNKLKSTSKSIRPLFSDVFTDEIMYSPVITYLNLHILDQNDNLPIFTNPPNDNHLVGFPNDILLGILMPIYYFKVEAYDLDEGLNAVIRYSISMPATFEINHQTGEIYPLGRLPEKPFKLLITAIDRDGSGLRTTTSLRIVPLDVRNIVDLTVNGLSNKNTSQLIAELSKKSSLDLKILSSTQIPAGPSNSSTFRQKRMESLTSTKIYVYGFDPRNGSQLMNSDVLIAELKLLDLAVSVDYYTIYSSTCDKNSREECKLEDWIIATISLGIVIFILLIILIIWCCVIRRQLKSRNSDTISESSQTEIVQHFNETERRKTPIQIEIPTDVVLSRSLRPANAEIREFNVNGVTSGESTSDAVKLNGRLVPYLEDESPAKEENRKVKFNELVERIEVIDDSDTETPKSTKM